MFSWSFCSQVKEQSTKSDTMRVYKMSKLHKECSHSPHPILLLAPCLLHRVQILYCSDSWDIIFCTEKTNGLLCCEGVLMARSGFCVDRIVDTKSSDWSPLYLLMGVVSFRMTPPHKKQNKKKNYYLEYSLELVQKSKSSLQNISNHKQSFFKSFLNNMRYFI